MATSCASDLEWGVGAGYSRVTTNERQSGVMVSTEEISEVYQRLCTKAEYPSDDCDTDTNSYAVSVTSRAPSDDAVCSSDDLEVDSVLPPLPMPVPQTEQFVHTPHTNSNSQTVNNWTSATQTNPNSQDVNNGSTVTQTNSCGPSMPKYPNFSMVPQRLQSFGAVVFAVSTKLLSVAGFYLVRNGGEDATRCYHCGIGLRHWSPEDDPWVEHARFSPKCDYLLTMKGQEFVNLIQLAVKYSSNQADSTTNQLGNSTPSNTSTTTSSEPNASKTREDLVRENAELRGITKCTFCTRREVSLVFLPCGHLISCEACGKEQRICRICNASIKGTVRTFRQ